MADPLRIAIVDGYPIFRKGLVDTISSPERVIVAEGGEVDDVLRIVAELEPDVLIIDPSISAASIKTISKALKGRADLKIIALTASDDEADVADALRCGIQGYVLKGVSGPELLDAIDCVMAGQSYVTPTLGSRLLMKARNNQKTRGKEGFAKAAAAELTHQDKWVLRHLVKGLDNQQLAFELGVTVRKAKYYLWRLFRKLGVRSRVEAILKAQKMGLGLPRKDS